MTIIAKNLLWGSGPIIVHGLSDNEPFELVRRTRTFLGEEPPLADQGTCIDVLSAELEFFEDGEEDGDSYLDENAPTAIWADGKKVGGRVARWEDAGTGFYNPGQLDNLLETDSSRLPTVLRRDGR